MAICQVCSKKMSIFDGQTIENKLPHNMTIGKPITVCNECYDQMKLLKKGDYEAYKYIHSFVDQSSEAYVKQFVETWEEKPEDIIKQEQAAKEEALEKKKEYASMKASIMLTTGFDFQGHNIEQYLGIVSGEAVLGTGFLSEFSAGISDLFGSESSSFSDKLETAKSLALDKILDKAISKNANAIIGIDFDYITFGNNMIGVIANGTLVKVQ